MAGPLAARAQQPDRLKTIGFLGVSASMNHLVAAFVRRLQELGWQDGSSMRIEYRWTEGRNERLPILLAELMGLKIDLIVAQGTRTAVAAVQAAILNLSLTAKTHESSPESPEEMSDAHQPFL